MYRSTPPSRPPILFESELLPIPHSTRCRSPTCRTLPSPTSRAERRREAIPDRRMFHSYPMIRHLTRLFPYPPHGLVQYTVRRDCSAESEGVSSAGGGCCVKYAVVSGFGVKVLPCQCYSWGCLSRQGFTAHVKLYEMSRRTQPWMVVGGRCAFSARKRKRAREPPRDMPIIKPTNAAVGGRTSRFRGRWTDIRV